MNRSARLLSTPCCTAGSTGNRACRKSPTIFGCRWPVRSSSSPPRHRSPAGYRIEAAQLRRVLRVAAASRHTCRDCALQKRYPSRQCARTGVGDGDQPGRGEPSQRTTMSLTLPTREPASSRTGRPSRLANEITLSAMARRTSIRSRKDDVARRRRVRAMCPASRDRRLPVSLMA